MGLPIGKDIAPFPSSQISLGLEPKREELDAMWIDGLGAQALPVSQAVQKGQVAATPFPKHHPSEGSVSPSMSLGAKYCAEVFICIITFNI